MKSPSSRRAQDRRAAETAGQLRVAAGRYPEDAALGRLVAELSARSEEFRRVWASGEVLMCAGGRKRFRHRAAGEFTLDYETLHVPAAPGETGVQLHVFSAAEGSADAAALAAVAAVAREVSPAPAG
ncbi:hypothetical protein [Streptomyces hoynatensis]|uniref:MmyB-like transcription regulator ligand binding domain-containing protein n=1 Tax=Streptomyces hoynatensis TaxID=1141874 RepID=A0A3A9YKZ6_9ACTN|nr:hypothetical protein [Streptomyces hoynatensis]RKN37218.1 hypothetical protein D7294_28820 [Streptomyces hoynatensis]